MYMNIFTRHSNRMMHVHLLKLCQIFIIKIILYYIQHTQESYSY